MSLEVHAGEAVGLAGLLGSGRTETMRLMFGADPLEHGSLSIGGEAVALKSPQDAIARGLAYLTEDRKAEGIVPELSVRDNLTLVCLRTLAKNGVVDVKKQQAIVDRFIASLGIKLRSPDQPIRELSGGNQQKVLLARWLAAEPSLLLLDEPTRGIDVGAKADVAKIVRELRDAGLAVLLSASELEELTAVADRAVVIRDGRTVAELNGARHERNRDHGRDRLRQRRPIATGRSRAVRTYRRRVGGRPSWRLSCTPSRCTPKPRRRCGRSHIARHGRIDGEEMAAPGDAARNRSCCSRWCSST